MGLVRSGRVRLLALISAVVVAVLLVAFLVGRDDDADDGPGKGEPDETSATEATGPPSEPCGSPAPTRPDGTPYACAFSDEFAGTALDRTKWLAQATWYSGVSTGNKDCYVDRPANIAVADDALHLTSRVEAAPFVCTSPLGDFEARSTGATVATRGRFTQVQGRFEFRARFPTAPGAGFHSALWLYPQGHPYGPWPASGEVDVAEWFSAKPELVYPSVHYAGEVPALSSGQECMVATPDTEFHTYAVEWTATVMRFEYDGEVCFEHAWTPDPPLVAPQPFDRPFYVVLSQAFGSLWNAPDATTPPQGTLVVDWVRVWK